MKRVMFGAVALFVVGCAGSQPALTFRSPEAPSHPVAQRAPKEPVGTPHAAHAARAMTAKPVSSPAPRASTPASAAPNPDLDPNVAECAHILEDVGKSRQLLAARIEGASAPALTRAVLTYLAELEALDDQHPNLHHALKLRVAKLSSRATRAKEEISAPTELKDETTGAVLDALDAIGEYCGPIVVVQGEAS